MDARDGGSGVCSATGTADIVVMVKDGKGVGGGGWGEDEGVTDDTAVGPNAGVSPKPFRTGPEKDKRRDTKTPSSAMTGSVVKLSERTGHPRTQDLASCRATGTKEQSSGRRHGRQASRTSAPPTYLYFEESSGVVAKGGVKKLLSRGKAANREGVARGKKPSRRLRLFFFGGEMERETQRENSSGGKRGGGRGENGRFTSVLVLLSATAVFHVVARCRAGGCIPRKLCRNRGCHCC